MSGRPRLSQETAGTGQGAAVSSRPSPVLAREGVPIFAVAQHPRRSVQWDHSVALSLSLPASIMEWPCVVTAGTP